MVVGVGVRGLAVVETLASEGPSGLGLAAICQDAKAVGASTVPHRILVPDAESDAAVTLLAEAAEAVVVVLAGQDGAVASAYAPALARLLASAESCGFVGLVMVQPFSFEGARRVAAAAEAAATLQSLVDMTVVVEVDALMQEGMPVTADQAFTLSNSALVSGVRCIAGMLQSDQQMLESRGATTLAWQDSGSAVLRRICQEAKGHTSLGTGTALPQNLGVGLTSAVVSATSAAVAASPFLASEGMSAAASVLCLVSGGPDVQIPTGVLEAAAGTLAQSLHPSCQLLTGLGPNVPSLGGRVEVTLLVMARAPKWSPETSLAVPEVTPRSSLDITHKSTNRDAPSTTNSARAARQRADANAGAASGTKSPIQQAKAPKYLQEKLARNKALSRMAGGRAIHEPAQSDADGAASRTRAEADEEEEANNGGVASERAGKTNTEARSVQPNVLPESIPSSTRAISTESLPTNMQAQAKNRAQPPADDEIKSGDGVHVAQREETGKWEVGLASQPWTSWDASEPQLSGDHSKGFKLWPWGQSDDEDGSVVDVGRRVSAVLDADRMLREKPSPVLMKYPDGGSYDGNWLNGMQQGKGRRSYPNGDWYDGEWDQGVREGKGVCMSSGNKYTGNFRAGLPSGRGTVEFANGDLLEGQFKLGHAFGACSLVFANGERYEGEFRSGNRHGHGITTLPSGMQLEEYWQHGTLISRSRSKSVISEEATR